MNQQQINRLEMMQTTNGYLDSNSAIWSSIPIVPTYKNQLTQAIDGIRNAASDQDKAQVFIGTTLQQLKVQVAEKMDILDDVLEAYADDTEDAELLTKAKNSKSDYLRLTHEDFETKTRNVIDLLEVHVANMADYGITQDQIDDAKLTFGSFQDKRNKPRSYQIASRVATQNLADLVTLGTNALEKLDRVMKRFKRSNTTFYNGYIAARSIVND